MQSNGIETWNSNAQITVYPSCLHHFAAFELHILWIC